jgi:hypothetical protein
MFTALILAAVLLPNVLTLSVFALIERAALRDLRQVLARGDRGARAAS